uniref:Uncharacterized protein n=1 Tax=Arundo donax TaxID=35708 RepID=A0A0A9B6K8_ARUDO
MDKTYHLYRVYESIRIDVSSVLGNNYGVVSIIRLLLRRFFLIRDRLLLVFLNAN